MHSMTLRKLLAAAPPTPWVVEEREGWWEVAPANLSARLWPPMAFDDGSACGEYSARCLVKSRDLIVAAVNALPELLDEIERLKTRVGWLDHLDTPEGRAMHATEAVKVENEELRAEVERLRNHISSSETASCVELGALRLSLKQVDADVDALRADLREAQAEIERLKAELAKYKECTP